MSYIVRDYTLPPGQTVTVYIVGAECAVYQATKDFLLSHDDLDPQFITGGMKLKPKNGFESIVMLNPHNEPVTVKLGITDGQIEDSRLSTSAPVQVSEIQATVPVADPYNGSSFSSVSTQIGYVNEATKAIGRGLSEQFNVGGYYQNWAAKHKVGASWLFTTTVSTTALTIIDPAANVSGVILRQLNGYTSQTVAVFIGSSPPSSYTDTTKQRICEYYTGSSTQIDLPLYLPAGMGLFCIGGGGGLARHGYSWDYL